MNRRFNFTGRKRIGQEHINIELNDGGPSGVAMFDAVFELGDLELPPDARVMVEAFRGSSINRYTWGTVGRLTPPEDRRLTHMQNNPSFRIKVVAPDNSGMLLAMADHIRPHREERRGSLVWLDTSNDLGKEVWRLDFGDGSNPTLYLNASIEGIGREARSNRAFQSLVFPEVLRAMLTQAIADDADTDEDGGQWHALMLFVGSFHDVPIPPKSDSENGSEEGDERSSADVTRWINDAVRAFTQKNFPASDIFAQTLEGTR